MKCVGKCLALAVTVLISATCLAQVEVIREKKNGKVISVEANGPVTGKPAMRASVSSMSVDVAGAAWGILSSTEHTSEFLILSRRLRLTSVENDSLGMRHVHFAVL